MGWKRYGFMWFSATFLVGLGAIEVMAHGWMAPMEAAEMKNPIVLDAGSTMTGKEAYLDNCATCHGEHRHADGEAHTATDRTCNACHRSFRSPFR